jgi:hypothetical protein
MSPEQAQGFEVDHRSDLYTLGVLLYQMLSGSPPFTGDSPMQVALMQVTEIPKPIIDMSRHRPLPMGLSALVTDLLEKEPGKRPGSANSVRQRLLQIAKQLPNTKVTIDTEKQPVVRAMTPPATMPEVWKGGDFVAEEDRTELVHRVDPQADRPLGALMIGRQASAAIGSQLHGSIGRGRLVDAADSESAADSVILFEETIDSAVIDSLVDFEFKNRRPMYVMVALAVALLVGGTIAVLERGGDAHQTTETERSDEGTAEPGADDGKETARESRTGEGVLAVAETPEITGAVTQAYSVVGDAVTAALHAPEIPAMESAVTERSERRSRHRRDRGAEIRPLGDAPDRRDREGDRIGRIDHENDAAIELATEAPDHSEDRSNRPRRPVQLADPVTIPASDD